MSHAAPSPTYPGTPSFSAPGKTFIPLLTSEGRVTAIPDLTEEEIRAWVKVVDYFMEEWTGLRDQRNRENMGAYPMGIEEVVEGMNGGVL